MMFCARLRTFVIGFKKGYVRKYIPLIIFTIVIIAPTTLHAQSRKMSENDIPHLAKHGSTMQLIVKGKPYLMLAGETGNSSASNINYMDNIWPKIVKMHLNTLVVPIYWDLIESKKGEFNFSLVDHIITSAREHHIKLVFLWYGSWKNSMSCYVPLWVKTNEKKYPRAREKNGRAEEILTAFNKTNRDADAHAFSTLMKHLRKFDKKYQTVVMVQVENEIGMIPDARDYSKSADKTFNSAVPREFIDYLKKNKDKLNKYLYDKWQKNGFKTQGDWNEIFGKGLSTDEIFMAWNFAKYANYVAAAGKKQYPLPMYVNAALIRPGYKPGQYPSGGPLPHLMDIWKAAAPDINFMAPDIYFKNFAYWISKFDVPVRKQGQMFNQFFIPEAGNNQSLVDAFYAIAQHNVMGYSPFSIESLSNPSNNQVSKGYKVLAQLTPLILANQGKGTMRGVILNNPKQVKKIKLGSYVFNVHHEYSWPYAPKNEGKNPRFGGMIIKVSPNVFYIAGRGMVITFGTAKGDSNAGIGSDEKGHFKHGKWIPGLYLNGDQTNQGRHINLPGNTYSIQKVRLYKYK